MKVQCWGPVWSEKVGGGWISSRSGWLLELLTELTIHDRLRNSTHDINQFTWQSESENAQPSQFMRCLHLTECCGPRQILTNSQPTNQYNKQEARWENKSETRELLQFWIHWKQLWHWYWNIAGINTIYLSIFTLIYSPWILCNEIIESYPGETFLPLLHK